MVCHTHTHTHTRTHTSLAFLKCLNHTWQCSGYWPGLLWHPSNLKSRVQFRKHTSALAHSTHEPALLDRTSLAVIAWNTRWCPERTPLNECHVLQHVLVWSMSIKHESIEVTFHMFGATLDSRHTGCIKSQSWMHITPTIPVWIEVATIVTLFYCHGNTT